MDRAFQLLFKYRPIAFEQGEFTFLAPSSFRGALVVAALLGTVGVATYTLASGRAGRRERGVMAGLRVALLAILLFCLLQPALVISTVAPQQNFLGILVDDSRSMRLADAGGEPRSAFVAEAFTPGGSALLEALAERFTLRFFRFSSTAARMESPSELTWEGTSTHLAEALDAARQELSGVPLAGLVLVTDGADTGGRPLAPALVPLQAAGIPVFTVGVGEEAIAPDIEMGRVELPRSVLDGTTLLVDVVITQSGIGRRTVPLIVEDDTRLLAEEQVELGPDGEPVVARVAFHLEAPGPHRVRVRIPVQQGERVAENNAREAWIEVRGDREKILYFEGEPRFEVKFLRRAVAGDANLQLVVLQRTAESKFLRLEVDDADELAGGFPRSREELFRYRALILGSVEASFFSQDQLQMIADFVSQRGGGLLMLGGRGAFAEGGWTGTAVAEVLPVALGAPAPGRDAPPAEVKARLTPAGAAHAALRLSGDAAQSAARWDSLPALTVVNPVTQLRPGATALLVGSGEGPAGGQVVLAHQRYGRGRALAFTPQDSWLWQMHADVPLENESHETFWRQTLRWLLDGTPSHLTAALERDQVEPGRTVRLTATVRDSTFLEVNDAQVVARVLGPTGLLPDEPMAWTVERDGEYAAQLRADEEGEYEIEVVATRDGVTLGTDTTYLRAAPSSEEYFGAGRRTALLARIARETGGRSYTPRSVHTLPEDITLTGAGVTLVEERELWDMPVLFLLMLALMGAEWALRRSRGLA